MSIEATERTEIIKLLVLMYNAAPGSAYLSQVVYLYETLGKNLGALANSLDDVEPYTSLYPNFQSAEEFAAAFLTPLGLQDDPLSVEFIVSRFNDNMPKGQIVYEAYLALQIVAGGGTSSQYENAFAILENKTAVAEYYSVTKGVTNFDFAILQLVLNGITADPDSVTGALSEIDNGTRGVSGIEATLTPTQDTVVGTNASDAVQGLFGDKSVENNTYTAGDSIDLGAGTDRLNLVALGGVGSQAIVVKNTEAINIQDTVGATFNALLVENAPGISFFSTVKDQTSMVTNAALASVMGLEGAGNLTVDYAVTSGKADAASVSLNGAGTSATARSTINVADGNTVEKVSIAATGTNFVTLTGGTVAASLVITGDGTNNFSLSGADSLAAVTSVDASTSTGANTFAMGGNLNTGTTIKGGTGADAVSTTLSSPTLVSPTLNGVETLGTTFTAGAVVDLGSATGLTTVTAGASTAAMTFQNAQSSVATVTVSSLTTADSALKFGYDPASKGNLALNIGSATDAVNLGLVTLSGTTSVTINTVGALDHDADDINIAGNQTGLTVNVATGSSLGWGTLTVKGDVDSYVSSLGTDSSFSGYTTIVGDLDAMTVTVAAGASRGEFLNVENVGDVTINATGNETDTQQTIFAAGDIGSINATLLGDEGFLGVGAFSSGGTIGDINFGMTGDDSTGRLFAFAISSGGDAVQDIGNVAVTLNGDNQGFSGYAVTSQGDLGSLSLTVTGQESSAQLGGQAIYAQEMTETVQVQNGGTYGFGGNVGDITLAVDGDDSHGTIYAAAIGGDVGNINVSILGDGAGGGVLVYAVQTPYSGAPNSDIGNVSVSVGDGGSFSGYFTALGGDLGDILVDVGGDGMINLTMTLANAEIGTTDVTAGDSTIVRLNYETVGSGGGSGGSGSGAGFVNSFQSGASAALVPISGGVTTVGNITATFGDDGHLVMNVSGAYDFGDITATFGDNGSFSGNWVTSVSGGIVRLSQDAGTNAMVLQTYTVGDINMTFGNEGDFDLSVASGSYVDFGDINVAFQDSGDFDMYLVSGSYGDVGDIFATFGDDGTFNYGVYSGGGTGLSIGAISLTFGANAEAGISINPGSATNYASVGKVSLTGGDSSSHASVYLSASGGLSIDVMGGVDASAWLGSLNVDLSSVALGTTVYVGAAGSFVEGTENADNIFLGAGLDAVQFDRTPTATDVIFSFTAGAGKDALTVPAGTAALLAVMTADAAATAITGDVFRLVDIAGGQDITTAAGLVTALESGGDYASISQAASSNFTIITAASSTASAFYVFDVSDDGDAVFETGEVVLIGVVNAAAAGVLGSLVLGNFQAPGG